MRIALFLSLGAVACATAAARPAQQPAAATAAPAAAARSTSDSTSADRPQYASTYKRRTEAPVLIRNATIMTAAGQEIPNGQILLRDGKIVAVGRDLTPPPDAVIVDGTGRFVTPGIIDSHSHIGVYAAPGRRPSRTAMKPPIPSRPKCGRNIRSGRRTRRSRLPSRAASPRCRYCPAPRIWSAGAVSR